MKMSKSLFRKFLFFKLPIAWVAGIRLVELSEHKAITKVKLTRWSQNPFKSMFWAVQGMAAELSTGILCIDKIQNQNKKVSMLVTEQKAVFVKKAVGKITFTCEDGELLDQTIQQAIQDSKGHTVWVKSTGVDEQQDVVSKFEFLWSFKVKN